MTELGGKSNLFQGRGFTMRHAIENDEMANAVNLDALIARADLEAPGESGEDITSLSVIGLERKGFLYPSLRKPDFQRETANWSPEQVADLIGTFARRDLIPAVILWRSGQSVFVIDGAHRLSALIAWVQDDYGDGDVSRCFFQNVITEEQQKAADKTRSLVAKAVGSYKEHKQAIDYPDTARADIAERAQRIGWQEISAQWIRNASHDTAEKSFFRINQGGTKIDNTEARILKARHSATAMASRAIIRGGTGHDYWGRFDSETQKTVEELGKETHHLLFEPALILPLKTLDLPLAGHGYGPKVLPFAFDLVTRVNCVPVPDSTNRRVATDDLQEDTDGLQTITFLKKVRKIVRRICSTDPSSLGLHPALYFYNESGAFQPTAMLSVIDLIKDWDTLDFREFTKKREQLEKVLLAHRTVLSVHTLGSGVRSQKRMTSFYQRVLDELGSGRSADEAWARIVADPDFSHLDEQAKPQKVGKGAKGFSRQTKAAAFLKDSLPTALRCPTCAGLQHSNGMQVGHEKHRRDGGSDTLDNAQMQHPFCNSTIAQ